MLTRNGRIYLGTAALLGALYMILARGWPWWSIPCAAVVVGMVVDP